MGHVIRLEQKTISLPPLCRESMSHSQSHAETTGRPGSGVGWKRERDNSSSWSYNANADTKAGHT